MDQERHCSYSQQTYQFHSALYTLRECQPGYHYNPSTFKCECVALEGCDPYLYIRQGYWMGHCTNNGSELCTGFCPYGFCSYSKVHPGAHREVLPNDSNSLSSKKFVIQTELKGSVANAPKVTQFITTL